MKRIRFLLITLGLCAALSAHAQVVFFDFLGKAGSGLLPQNENPTQSTPARGGERGQGLFLNTATNQLTLNFGFGSAAGFSDLSSPITMMHLHATPTADFTLNGPVVIDLFENPGFDNRGLSGLFGATLAVTDAQETALLENRMYLNIHTVQLPGGELRANLVTGVPEPSTYGLLGGALVAGLALVRRWRRKASANSESRPASREKSGRGWRRRAQAWHSSQLARSR